MNCMEQPRLCEEHVAVSALPALTNGSPPHMWGTPSARSRHLDNPGFTPAHAGNTRGVHVQHQCSGVHPRTCGEHTGSGSPFQRLPGSPPHMRGTQPEQKSSGALSGFTPAHAGNTRGVTLALCLPKVHPRTCGEHTSRNGHIKPKPEPTNREKL
jgi:hypothetical protein